MYDSAIQINPNDAEAYFKKGVDLIILIGGALQKLHKYNDAIIMYNRAI